MRSMTGFGQSSLATDYAEIEVQIRTVNSRYLDLKIRLPRDLLAMELELKKQIREHLHRGRVDLWVETRQQEAGLGRLNRTRVSAYLQAARELAELGVPGELEISTLLGRPDIFDAASSAGKEVLKGVKHCVEEALQQVLLHRRAEGRALREDLQQRVDSLARISRQIEEQAQEIVGFQRQRLQERLASLTDLPEVDGTRLAQEVAFFAERADISEEITRLSSHLARFRELLQEDQVVGKNLDFLCQELNREMNTVLSKAGRTGISETAVEGKSEIEKLREQVQNVE